MCSTDPFRVRISRRGGFLHFRTKYHYSMIYYQNPLLFQNLKLSIDDVILDVSITRPELLDVLETMIASIELGSVASVISWESRKPGTFRRQVSVRIDDDRSFWLGIGLVGNGVLEDRCRLDFNPNKVANDANFQMIHQFLIRNSREVYRRIPRFDFAIDIPVERNRCFLVKDRRMYIERRHGSEFTQYLGSKSSTVGRVKLYNKAIEADLNYPLTRLELTLDPTQDYEKVNFPVVYYIDSAENVDEVVRITDTERFILNALLQGYGSLDGLGRKTRKKIEELLRCYVKKVEITKIMHQKIIEQLNELYLYAKKG